MKTKKLLRGLNLDKLFNRRGLLQSEGEGKAQSIGPHVPKTTTAAPKKDNQSMRVHQQRRASSIDDPDGLVQAQAKFMEE